MCTWRRRCEAPRQQAGGHQDDRCARATSATTSARRIAPAAGRMRRARRRSVRAASARARVRTPERCRRPGRCARLTTGAKRRTARSRTISPTRGMSGGASHGSADTAQAPRSTPTRPPAERQKQALRQELAEDPRRRRAEGRSDPHLARPGARAGEQKVRDVRRRDQQDDADRAEEREKHGPCRAEEALVEGLEREAKARIGLGVGARQPRRECVGFGERLLGRDAGRAAGRHAKDPKAPVRELVRRPRELVLERNPEFEARARKLEVGRHHADDRERTVREREGLSDDGRVAPEAARPEPMRQDGEGLARIARDQGASERGAAEHRKEVGGHQRAAVLLASRTEADVVEIGGPDRDGVVGGDAPAQLVDVGQRPARHDDAVGRRVGEGLPEDVAHDGKDRRVGSDSEGECRDRGGREAGTPEEEPDGVADILKQRAHAIRFAARSSGRPGSRVGPGRTWPPGRRPPARPGPRPGSSGSRGPTP